eukprot:CAMPEP_0115867170 /NCGR_PEP_ID=MMETSP0287-20121206/20628_1 /TAXON_ID=412157 /ORGANISM="Chrysochromulina rotalis, Strain UIO044" /LENGTH=62 /DNA_ID=CAMNT_0003321763 /DNA_START=274 /DNA_END=459 /DNA_ORIENTATION=+
MTVEELDHELQHIVSARGGIVKEDARRDKRGRFDVVTKANKVVHMLTDTCLGTSSFVQLKLW